MKKRPIELQLDALAENPAQALGVLRAALADRSASVVARAAKRVAERAERALVPDLQAAFERLLVDAVKRDPACRGKLAVLRALHELEEYDAELWLKALQHRQLEPVFGGREDTAVELRGLGAVGLALSRWPEAAQHLVELLVDSGPSARLSGVRALGWLGGPEGALLLRYKALLGDEEPAVVGECLEGLLRLEGAAGVAFVQRFLKSSEHFEMAAMALADSRLPEAREALVEAWSSYVTRERRRVLLVGFALLRASDFLLEQLEEDWIREALAELEPGLLEPVVAARITGGASGPGTLPTPGSGDDRAPKVRPGCPS